MDVLFEKAKSTLEANWKTSYTIPSSTLYPHQWSWDSAFIAIGNSFYDKGRAIKELDFLFDAQWEDGMVPHIVFNKKAKTYFPGAGFYDAKRLALDNAPKHVETSSMTQPPMHTIACYYIYKNMKEKKQAKAFLKRIYPKLRHFHSYLMAARDPEKSGLVTIVHPWESGLDDSPIWDSVLSNIDIRRSKDKSLDFERLDTKAVGGAKETIPTDEMYNKFVYLIELMKQFKYDAKKMCRGHYPFKVKDIVFSSILYVANKHLIEIADIIGNSSDVEDIHKWMSRTEQNFYKYFLPRDGSKQSIEKEETLFCDYDLVGRNSIKKRTVSSLVPIYTGLIPKEDIDYFVKWINHSHWCGDGNCHVPLLPSVDLSEPYFDHLRYWRGPIWINANWMIWKGLLDYGYEEDAQRIRKGVLELVENHGFREYYDPYSGKGLGGKSFSWSAALAIDMIKKAVIKVVINNN